MSTVRLGPVCGKPLVLQVLHGEPLECRKREGHSDECSAVVSGSFDMKICGALDPARGRAQACWLEPEHPGRHTWDRRGSLCWHDPNSYTDEAGVVHCQLAIGHDGPHRMEW